MAKTKKFPVVTVGDLQKALKKANPKASISMSVGWAKDTACADEDGVITVTVQDGSVDLSGWMSDCGTNL